MTPDRADPVALADFEHPRTPTVAVALNAAAAEVGPIAKDDENRDQGFKFRGIERIMEKAGPALTKHGVTVLPRVLSVDRAVKERGQNRNQWDHLLLTVEYVFTGPAGDELRAVVVSEGLDNGDKAASKAMTMAYKTAILQALKIGSGEHDADASTPEAPSPAIPPRPQASEAQRDDLKARIAALDDDGRASVKAAWRQAKLWPLAELHADEVDTASELIATFEVAS